MITLENIFVNVNANTKNEVLKLIANKAVELKIANNEAVLLDDLLKREQEGSTGFNDGIAIPHAQSEAVSKPSLIIMKLENEIDFEAMDNKPSKLFISILVPKKSETLHLEILQQLSRKLVDENYIKALMSANTPEELFYLINPVLEVNNNKIDVYVEQDEKAKNIVAVCACPMGLAHTFMAAEVIEDYAKKNGYNFKIETQGADGIKNYLTDEDINSADVIIHAVAITPQDVERFEGKVLNEVGLQELVKNPVEILDQFMTNTTDKDANATIKEAVDKNKKAKVKNNAWTKISKHLMSGISYMIPVLVMGGLLGAISLLVPYILIGIPQDQDIASMLAKSMDADSGVVFSQWEVIVLYICYALGKFGFTLFGFAIPIFAGFTAYSIGGKVAWPIGFIGGYIAVNPVELISFDNGAYVAATPVASGFLGAVIVAFLAGYVVLYLNKYIKLTGNWLAFKSTFLVPLLSVLIIFGVMVYIVTPIGGAINTVIENAIEKAGESGEFAYAAITAGATAFDLGGPVNKAASFVAIGFTTEGILPITARNIAVVVPPIGLGLATILDGLILRRKVYSSQYSQVGKTSIFLAFMGISEGAIPFALEKPLFVIPINVIGAIIGAITAVALGAVQYFPESAIWAWPLITSGKTAYVFGILVGSLFIALANVFYRGYLQKQGKLDI